MTVDSQSLMLEVQDNGKGIGDAAMRGPKSLGLLEGTVKVHVRDILRKLGVSNRTQAAMLVARAQSPASE